MADATDYIPTPGLAPIPLSTTVHEATTLYHMVGSSFSGGLTAGRLHNQLENVDWQALQSAIDQLTAASTYLGGPLQTELGGIKTDFDAAYQGLASDPAASTIAQATSAAAQLSTSFKNLAAELSSSRDALWNCWLKVKGYSRGGSDVSNVTSMFGGGPSQDDKARDAWGACTGTLRGTGDAMTNVSTPGLPTPPGPANANIPVPTNPPAGYQTPDGLGPGVGAPGADTPSVAPIGSPGFSTSTSPTGSGLPTYPTDPTLGANGGGTGSGYGGAGGVGDPGSWGGSGIGAGATSGVAGSDAGAGSYAGPGAGSSAGSGAGGYGSGAPSLDDGSALASAGAGGTGAGDLAAGAAGLSAGNALTGAAGGSGSGGGGAGVGTGGSGGPGGIGGAPMGGRDGGSGSGEDERERGTWLVEDEDVWGNADGHTGVIS